MANDRKILGITLTAEGTQEVQAAFRSLGKEGEDAAKRIKESFEAVNFKGDLTGVVKKELGSLGAAGEDAARKINAALEKVGVGETVTARLVRLKQSFAELADSTKLTREGFANIKRGADNMVAGVDRAIKSIGLLSAAIGGAVGAAALLANRSADTAEQIQNQADAFGVSFENMQKLRNAINAVGGDEGLLEKAFTKFTAAIDGTNDAAETAQAALTKLQKAKADDIKNASTQAQKDQINTKYRDKLAEATDKLQKAQAVFNSTQQDGFPGLLEYAQRLNTLKSSQEQLAQVTKDFGAKGAVTLLAFLKSLAGEFDDAQNSANKMLPALDTLGQTSLAGLDAAGDKLATNFSRLALLVGSRIAPAFTAVYDVLREIIGTVGPALADAFGSVANAIATQVLENKGAILAFAKDVTASAIQIARDISSALSGVNGTSNWIIRLKNDVVGAFEFIRATVSNVLVPAFRGFAAILDPIARAMNALFGTEFTGNSLAAVAIFAQLTGGVKILGGALEIAWGSGKILFDLIFNGKAKVLAFIETMRGLFNLARAASGAIIAVIAANPEIAILVGAVALAAAGIGILATRQTEAEKAASAHKDALAALDQAYADVEAGVDGAARAWEEEKQKQIDSANAALANAEAQLQAAEAVASALQKQRDAQVAATGAVDRYTALNLRAAQGSARVAKTGADAWRQSVSGLRAEIARLENPNRRLASTTDQIANSMNKAAGAANGLQAGFKRIELLGPGGLLKVFEVPSQELLDAQAKARALKETLSQPGNNALLDDAKAKATEFLNTIDALGQSIQAALINLSADASAQLQALADAIPAFFDGVPAALQQVFSGVGTALADSWRTAMDTIVALTRSMVSNVNALISGLQSTLTSLTAAIRSAAAQASGGGGGGGGGSGYASGGYISGPGSGTSDSIPAWLSNGEFVLRAAAVNRLPLGFLHALNSARFDFADILRRFMGTPMRFAAGGLVKQPRISLAGLSLPGGGGPTSSLTLVLGGDTFPGLTGPADTLARLERAIKSRRIRSTGRPSPYER